MKLMRLTLVFCFVLFSFVFQAVALDWKVLHQLAEAIDIDEALSSCKSDSNSLKS